MSARRTVLAKEFFYKSSSGSCYVIENEIGSIVGGSTSEKSLSGFIKMIVRSSPNSSNASTKHSQGFPLVAMVLLPLTGFLFMVALGLFWWRNNELKKIKEGKLAPLNSLALDDLDAFSIPGLPVGYSYSELEVATDNFKTEIGSGGFGAVYIGILLDNTVVAVKKMASLRVRRE